MTYRICANCYETIAPSRRKCVKCKAPARFARCETVEETKAREDRDNQIEDILQKILSGEEI